ncbi:histidine phosphatase superfamily [Tricharina praecox]|uniref:histidine phosphatase superfamily n=1 Tax=Tricharina praecox TaxID=43433 RepID=UPI00221FF7FE|nr:histidine phosphatase superfamily [Tricharina praecox]KAI5856554.1 histidine phosphatase superfamily [Tricharina praecox]
MSPRLILARHGETAWTLTGAHTSTTDLPLTARGRATISLVASSSVGRGRAIDPARLSHVFVSPRLRARETLDLLLPQPPAHVAVTTDDRCREWGYGEYEGLPPAEIRKRRREQGLDTERPWDIWVDGTPGEGGESPESLAARIDAVIEDVKAIQKQALKGGERVEEDDRDVLVVAHGHFLRAFVKRWVGLPLASPLLLVLDPGGIAVMGYAHGRVEEPAWVVGGVFGMADVPAEEGKK